MAKALVVMGSDSDLKIMSKAISVLEELGVDVETHISSAHRLPEKSTRLAREAETNGVGVIVAGAGMAAHLPGVLASHTILPVIGVPIGGGPLGGVDALYSIVQMPKGIPVATVAIDGAYNAGILAAQILASSDAELRDKLKTFRQRMATEAEAKDDKLQAVGYQQY